MANGAPVDEEARPGGAARRQFFGRFLWVSGGRVLGALLQFALILLLIRRMPPGDFGFLSAVLGVVVLAQTGFDLGIGTFIIRERARAPCNGAIAVAVRLNGRLSLLLFVLFGGTLAVLGGTVDLRFLLLVPLAASAAGERNADALLGIAFADGDVWINTLNLVGRRLAAIALFGLFGALDVAALPGYAMAVAIPALVSATAAQRVVAPRLAPPDATAWRDILRNASAYWINSVATQARNLDVSVAALFGSAIATGHYGAVSRLTMPLRILPTSLAGLLLPVAARRNAATLMPLVLGVAAATGIMAVLFTCIALMLPFATPRLLGADYAGAIPALQVACGGLVFASAASLLGALLQGVGLRRFVAASATAMTLVCLGGVAIGMSLAGAAGAAVGLSAGFVAQSALLAIRLFLFISRREPNH